MDDVSSPNTGNTKPKGGAAIMLIMRFSLISRNQWEASTKSEPIAKVTRRKGRCSVSVTANRPLNREELDSLSVFMREQEQ
jgi:hypothetical protein